MACGMRHSMQQYHGVPSTSPKSEPTPLNINKSAAGLELSQNARTSKTAHLQMSIVRAVAQKHYTRVTFNHVLYTLKSV
jgi:hypothetical protein